MAPVVASVILMGSGSVLIKYIDVEGLALSFHRTWVTVLVAWALLAARKARPSAVVFRRSAAGGIAYGLNSALIFTALKLTTVANASVIIALQPAALLALVGPLFGERIRSLDVVATATAVVGVGIVMFGSSSLPEWSLLGDGLALASLATWTWYFVASKQARRTMTTLEYHAAATAISLVVLLPLLVITGQGFVLPRPHDWPWVLLLVVGPGGGQLLVNWSHQRVPLSLISLLTLGMPVVATGLAALVLDESLVALQFAGMIIVVASLAVMVRNRVRPTAVTPVGVAP